MREYLLFIDIEASGLPKKWNEPYSKAGNWPHVLQLSWIICTKDGQVVKMQDHYIKDNDFEITRSAKKIHGITREFLDKNGENRQEVMELLTTDINQYLPLAIGHFMELDFRIIGAEFYRTGIENPLFKLPLFCTMIATTHMVRNPVNKYLRLADLYLLLFNKPLLNPHNAVEDVKATVACFFELLKRGEIDGEMIEDQDAFEKGLPGSEKKTDGKLCR